MKITALSLTFALSISVHSHAHAQSRASISVSTPAPNATAKPAPTDEYGIPLKVKKPAASASASATAQATAPKTRVAAKKKSKKKSRVNAQPEQLENQAIRELMLEKEDLSTGVLPTPATVRSRIDEVKNPIRVIEYRLGVSLQPFTPEGSMPVSDLVPYDLEQAGTNPMVALEGQWLPVHFENQPGLETGLFASLGYSQFSLNLRAPTGVAIEETKLHAVKAQLGVTVSYQLPKSPLWSVHGNVGVGRLLLIQSSSVSFANTSSGVNFASLGASAERSLLPKLSVFGGYDLRVALERVTSGADVPNHNFLVGFLGNFE